jgi:hypothetical protein
MKCEAIREEYDDKCLLCGVTSNDEEILIVMKKDEDICCYAPVHEFATLCKDCCEAWKKYSNGTIFKNKFVLRINRLMSMGFSKHDAVRYCYGRQYKPIVDLRKIPDDVILIK